MKKTSIRLSLIISTYNNTRLLSACLRSVARQSVLPYEILVADDGSGPETRGLIEAFRRQIDIPIQYIWQEDRGFRLSVIRNRAIAASSGNYIIQINGDLVLGRHFIEDHLRVARRGSFVCGNRIPISQTPTRIYLKRKRKHIPWYARVWDGNAYRFPLLQKWMAAHYRPFDTLSLHDGNMAFWRDDLIRVNAYNEDLSLWGYEERELTVRLINSGVEQRFLRLGGICFHLDHPIRMRRRQELSMRARMAEHESALVRCTNGVDKYIPSVLYAAVTAPLSVTRESVFH